MITTTILAIVESFLATLAYAVLFEAILYSMWNYRYGRVAFVSGNVSGDNCGIGVLCRNIGSSIDFQDFDGTEKMPDYDIFGFRNYSTCSGSRNILYSILPCDRSAVTASCEGIRGSENCICHCTGNYFCCINSKRCIPDSLLESKEKAEKVEEPWEYVIK